MLRSVTIALCALALGCSSHPDAGPPPAEQTTKATAAPKDPATAKTWIGSGAIVVDVRSPGEFAAGHLPTATNVPVDQLGQRLAEVDKLAGGNHDAKIVVYCMSGHRAAKAQQQLSAAGYTHVVNGGGLDDLQ